MASNGVVMVAFVASILFQPIASIPKPDRR